ncbi:MAG: hypothetical protein PXX82_02730, partial [Methanomassiliicoccales archaeon]|nr:hypothetical protein [Methanomassiliicoccales archaeon]
MKHVHRVQPQETAGKCLRAVPPATFAPRLSMTFGNENCWRMQMTKYVLVSDATLSYDYRNFPLLDFLSCA